MLLLSTGWELFRRLLRRLPARDTFRRVDVMAHVGRVCCDLIIGWSISHVVEKMVLPYLTCMYR